MSWILDNQGKTVVVDFDDLSPSPSYEPAVIQDYYWYDKSYNEWVHPFDDTDNHYIYAFARGVKGGWKVNYQVEKVLSDLLFVSTFGTDPVKLQLDFLIIDPSCEVTSNTPYEYLQDMFQRTAPTGNTVTADDRVFLEIDGIRHHCLLLQMPVIRGNAPAKVGTRIYQFSLSLLSVYEEII